MQKSEFTAEEELMIQREFEALLDDYAHTPHRQKVELITHAFNFAHKAHYGVRRLSGEPYPVPIPGISLTRAVLRDSGVGLSTSVSSSPLS